jgi:hypothetical protein
LRFPLFTFSYCFNDIRHCFFKTPFSNRSHGHPAFSHIIALPRYKECFSLLCPHKQQVSEGLSSLPQNQHPRLFISSKPPFHYPRSTPTLNSINKQFTLISLNEIRVSLTTTLTNTSNTLTLSHLFKTPSPIFYTLYIENK